MLYQNDDYGKDYLKGLKDGRGAKAASMIVAEESYETTEPTIDNHIVKLRSTGADVFMDITTPKFAAQAIKKTAEIDWKAMHGVAQTLVQVLQQCGDNLARENVMKQAASLKDFRTEMLLPGIMINTSPTDFAPISQLQLQRFKGDCSATSSPAMSAADPALFNRIYSPSPYLFTPAARCGGFLFRREDR